ncbi:DUF5681 domain-containing protein [Sedimentimonas flavescens]|uniref:DUF5681 domain-containing protein n=1 Tax=Sedimentimonas flavescens TaxID=2851012 RepID=A0ABT3A2Y9_9RHOB|nr:DUF5681 domain-containing protein [Sedimentimonas flavescens]MCV2880372.1 DUF5681 domain-containing protein [Sedimentimonas flavescens]
MSKKKDDDYEVGYRKPPKHSRFQKGRSGNANGRPKGAKGFGASLTRELEEMVTVREGGRQIKMSKAKALAKRLVAKALAGDLSAIKMLASLDEGLAKRAEAETEEAEVAVFPNQTDEEILRWYSASRANGGLAAGEGGGEP